MSEDFKVPGLNYEVTLSPYRGRVENPELDELREQAALAYENKNLEDSETPKASENTIVTPQLDFLKPSKTKEKNPAEMIANITAEIAQLREVYRGEFN